MNDLISIEAAADLIRKGVPLSLAGPESAMDQLPPGNWIGGTIPYFMVSDGGVVVNEGKVFATDLSHVGSVQFAKYGAGELSRISANAPANGFALTVIPAGSPAHKHFAAEAANFEGAFLRPTVGWISGVNLADLGKIAPKIYDGRTASKHQDGAVVAYVSLPADKLAMVEIVNLFEPDGGDVLRFAETSFEPRECLINGEKRNFAQYIEGRGLQHGRLPLIGDFAGARINVSIQSVDGDAGTVNLYAPVFPGVDYRFASPVEDYSAAFRERLTGQSKDGAVWSCNCILNFLFGELEGRAIGGVQGPVTFGEIAYQLLNQTLVTVRVV
jgi:hypothetical protein